MRSVRRPAPAPLSSVLAPMGCPMISEAALAAEVAQWLELQGYEVFHEVELSWQMKGKHDAGGRADLVGLHAPTDPAIERDLLVVECKRDLSFDLFAQASRWRRFANRVWIAVPYAKPSRGREAARDIARDHYGFGVIEQTDSGLRVREQPKYRATVDEALRASLRPEHQAGYARGGTTKERIFTTFKETCAKLAAYVAANPGCKLQDAVGQIQHHYASKASAISSLTKELRKGHVPNVYPYWKQGLWPTPKGPFETARVGETAGGVP